MESLDSYLAAKSTWYSDQQPYEKATIDFRDYGLFKKWNFTVLHNSGNVMTVFSVKIREQRKDTWTLEDVNDETDFTELPPLFIKIDELLTARKKWYENRNTKN